MQDNARPDLLPVLLLTLEDQLAIPKVQEAMRPDAMLIAVKQNDDAVPEVVHVYEPRHVPSRDDPRWGVYRNAAGVWAEDYNAGSDLRTVHNEGDAGGDTGHSEGWDGGTNSRDTDLEAERLAVPIAEVDMRATHSCLAEREISVPRLPSRLSIWNLNRHDHQHNLSPCRLLRSRSERYLGAIYRQG